MRNRVELSAVAIFIAIGSLTCFTILSTSMFRDEATVRKKEPDAVDNDWFMLQRSYPFDDIDPVRYQNARQFFHAKSAQSNPQSQPDWQLAGPSNIGGRITALALDPTNSNVIYAGAAAGGIWKSTDGANTWTNIFNESPSIGSLILDPTNPSILYVGTGEANPGGVAIYPGNGIWKSTDGGTGWTNLGLQNTGGIGRLAIHQDMPARIFAAALGRYRSRTEERGIYRSTDSGLSWERVLYLNDTTGACDVLIDPSNPTRVYAALWNRYRPITYSVIAGPNSGLWLSTNAGDTWTQVTNGFPFNDASLGRTTLAVSFSQPNILFALATTGASARGIFKSTDSGESWILAASGSSFGSESQVWYNNELAVHPTDPNTLLAGMTSFYKSTNGGSGWSSSGSGMHVDHHAIVFDRNNPNRVIVGNDGGVFTSTNLGTSWIKSFNLPISQFYAGTIDYTNPQRYYGGMQDNGTARTVTGSVGDWGGIYGGDGFYVLVDPTNTNYIYAESQNGGLVYSRNGGTSFSSGRTGINSGDRTNWSTPFVMDVNNTLTLYVGTYRIYKTTNGMQNWTPISGDLTRGQNGRIGTITTVDVASSNSNIIYVGTDDAKVSVTTDGGSTWTDVTGSLPNRVISRVTIDPDSANVCYVTLSGYLMDIFSSHIYKTTDYGQNWMSIGGDLVDMPLNDVIVDPVFRPNLYIATDVGVMYSTNGGINWLVLGSGLPEAPVHDLTLHSPARKLLASTHGRSMFTLDLTQLVSVRTISENIPSEMKLFQNYPNPFNPVTSIRFQVPIAAHVTLKIFDVTGREVSSLVNRDLQPGVHEALWSAENAASGTYIYRLSVGSVTTTRKMLVLK